MVGVGRQQRLQDVFSEGLLMSCLPLARDASYIYTSLRYYYATLMFSILSKIYIL
jgi:hypothetical protein